MLLPAASLLIFIGTYTPKDGASRGIYAVRLDPATGAFSAPTLAAETPNPAFLAWHRSIPVLYALGEGPGPDGKTSGGAVAFAYDPVSGRLSLLNARGAGGGNTTHLVADATGKMLVTVSYSGGQVAAFPLGPDGRLGKRTAFITHAGPLGPNKTRQEGPHPHSATLAQDNRFVFVADLGLDRVFSYRLDPGSANLTPNEPAFVAMTPGSGPRHTKFSNNGKFFYILGEIDGSLTVCAHDSTSGVLTPLQHTTTLPKGFKVTDSDRAAEVRVRPDGKFVYASNRGHDSIAVFAVQPDGTLKLVEVTPSGGKHPRNFNLTADGGWLVCANMDSDNLVSFKVDPVTGKLTPSGHTVTVPRPACVLFARSLFVQ
ncbi:MAG: lactonase family protein [Opitutae bacterium]|nr:lactonase family protein [Opitutae bacterium]